MAYQWKKSKEKLPQGGLVIWLTGLPCSGKTTIAGELARALKEKGLPVKHLDGDVVRKTINKNLGFSKEDRAKNLAIISEMAFSLNHQGNVVIASFVSPYQKQRAANRKKIKNYIEVFVNAPLAVCEKRDVKGMYKKARCGEINNFTGVSDPYEKPIRPEIEVRTDQESIEESALKVIDYLVSKRYVKLINRRVE